MTKGSEIQDIDAPDPEEIELKKRRISVYSTEALKTAAAVDRLYVNHPGFAQTIQALDRVFQIAGKFEMQQGITIEGPPGVGKTSVYRYFRRTVPSSSLFAEGMGIVGVRGIKRTTVGYLIRALLKAYKYPFSSGTEVQLYARRGILIDLIREKGTRILFIDESSAMLTKSTHQSSNQHETDVTDLLREILDECGVGVVLASYGGNASLKLTDHALASRMSVRCALEEFGCDAQWQGLLNAFEAQCSEFDLGFIKDRGIGKLLHASSLGNIRDLKRLLTEAVLIAIDEKQLTLNSKILGKAFNEVKGRGHDSPNPFD
jgi:hypothetical protein